MLNNTNTPQIIAEVQDALAAEFPALPANVYRDARPGFPVKVAVNIGGYEITFEGLLGGTHAVAGALKLARRVTADAAAE